MKPGKNDPPLTVIDLSTVTIGSLREVVEETDYFGFPCVLSRDSQLLAGFITRKDVLFLLGEEDQLGILHSPQLPESCPLSLNIPKVSMSLFHSLFASIVFMTFAPYLLIY